MSKKEKVEVKKPHHRRPRSLGGTDLLSNLYFVSPSLHRAWHLIFGNMNAYQICNYINGYIRYKPDNVYLVCDFINGHEVEIMGGSHHSKNSVKISNAWHILFGRKMKFDEIISYINNVWFDPSYHLYIVKLY